MARVIFLIPSSRKFTEDMRVSVRACVRAGVLGKFQSGSSALNVTGAFAV